MLCGTCCWRDFWKGERVWGEKHRSVRGGGQHVWWGWGACFGISFSKWWEGLLTSPSAHTLQKDTTPSSWRQREREHRKETRGKQRAERQETKCKARQALDTAETHASVVSVSTDGLVNGGEHQQSFSSNTQIWYSHKNKHVILKQNKSSENEDTDDVSEERWRSKGDRTTCQILS